MAGAFGAHALRARLDPALLQVFETAARYQLFHGLALVATGLVAERRAGRLVAAAAVCFVAGTLLFSGSLYALALSGTRAWGAVTPFGGLALIAGWLCLAAATWSRRPTGLLLALVISLASPARAAAPPGSGGPRTSTYDYLGRIDANFLEMFVSNVGAFANDRSTGNAGFAFPGGSENFALYSAGFWFAARVNGQLRIAVSEYDDEFRPGAMVGTISDNPTKPVYRVYKLLRTYDTPSNRTSALNAYNAGAVPFGAPPVTVLPNGDLSIGADQMLWEVHNDATATDHIAAPGGTLPLGIEVQHTFFAFNTPDPRNRAILVRAKVRNRRGNTLSQMHVGLWSDPDLGDPQDDLVGCDTTRSLAYCYNGAEIDLFYGTPPPAVGIDLLRGPIDRATGRVLRMTTFSGFRSGTDPFDSTETWNALNGLQTGGAAIVNPVTAQPTRFWFSGDPVAASGWRDSGPSDRRMLLAAGPFTMAPGDSQTVWAALLVATGTNRLDSVTELKATSDYLQSSFDAGLGVVGVPATPPGDLALRVWPNPGRAVRIAWSLPAAAQVRAAIYDLAGRLVADLGSREYAAGAHLLRWDGRGRDGRPAGAGVFFVRLTTPAGTQVSRIVRLE